MRSRFTRALALTGVLVAAAFGASACGGDGDSDEDQIKDVINEAVTTTDTSACTDLVTENFVETTYGEADDPQAACEQDVEDSTNDPDSLDFESIEVDGDSATTDVTFNGGENDGRTATIGLVKEGDDWKVDSFEAASSDTATGTEATTRTETSAGTDASGSPSVSGTVGKAVEQVARQQLEQSGQFTDAQVDCILDGIRDDLAKYSLDEISGGNLPPALNNKIVEVTKGCLS